MRTQWQTHAHACVHAHVHARTKSMHTVPYTQTHTRMHANLLTLLTCTHTCPHCSDHSHACSRTPRVCSGKVCGECACKYHHVHIHAQHTHPHACSCMHLPCKGRALDALKKRQGWRAPWSLWRSGGKWRATCARKARRSRCAHARLFRSFFCMPSTGPCHGAEELVPLAWRLAHVCTWQKCMRVAEVHAPGGNACTWHAPRQALQHCCVRAF